MTSHWESLEQRMPSWRHSAGISHLQPVNQSHMYMSTQQYTCCQWWNQRCLILSFFRVLSKNRYPGNECFTALSSPEIFALLFLLEEVKLHPPPLPHTPPSLNDKTSNIRDHLTTCFRHYDILAKSRSRMTMANTFSRQNDAGSRANTT